MRSGLRFLTFGFVLILFISLLPAESLAVDEASDWFNGSPLVSDQFDIGGDPLPFSINGNRDCIKQKVVTKPEKILPFWPYLQTEESHESCVVDTAYGAVSQTGYLKTAGETVFGRVTYPWGGSMTLLPVPRSANAIYIEPNPPNGVSLTLIRDFLSNIDGVTDSFGQITYKVKNGTSITGLNGTDGQALGVQIDSVAFSKSGKWMVADIPTLGLSRIDTASFSVKTFDVGFNYNIGVAPGVQSAVTNLGRYVVISSPSFTKFKLYDLGDCSSSTSCKSLDLYKYFKDNFPGFVSSVRLRFSTDYSLRMYMVQKVGTSNKVFRQTLRANGHDDVSFGYLGLGDSFASGEGAYEYKADTDNGINKCHLSLRSYPYLIADELGINEAESIACSGAVIEDINSKSQEYRGQVKDEIPREERKNVKQIISEFWPGYITQLESLVNLSPEVITISTVGNDIGFADKIKACLMPGTCFSSYEDRFEVAMEVNNQFDRLAQMYSDIKDEMQGKKVYVIGYPEIAMDGGSCGGIVRLDVEEIRFSNQLVRHLNKMIKAAADKIGFFYVDVEQAFYGYRLCETIGPNEAVNGITAGDDILDLPFTDFGGPIGNESFHPNDLGHRKFKETILVKTNNFAAPMPAPNQNAAPPNISDSMELLKDIPKSGRATNSVKYVSNLVEENTFIRDEIIETSIAQIISGFKALSNVEIWMYSNPVKLGDYVTDTTGNLGFSFTIPTDTPYGFHTLHIYGTSVTGKPIDLQKVIYVAHTPAAEEPVSAEKTEPLESSGDPKPPENNPETVAGNEQAVLSTTTIKNTQPPASSPNPAYAQTPYQTPTTTNTPQVAGTSTDNSGKDSEPVVSTNTSFYYLFLPIIFIPILLAIIHKLNQ